MNSINDKKKLSSKQELESLISAIKFQNKQRLNVCKNLRTASLKSNCTAFCENVYLCV